MEKVNESSFILLVDEHFSSQERHALESEVSSYLDETGRHLHSVIVWQDALKGPLFGGQKSDADNSPSNSILLVCLSDENLKTFLNLDRPVSFGLLPHSKAVLSANRFHIPAKVGKALQAIFEDTHAKVVDNFFCNDKLVLASVLIGDRQSMQPAKKVENGFWAKLVYLWKLILHLVHTQPFSVTLITGKDSEIQTVAKSLSLVYRPDNNPFTHRVVANGEQSEPNFHTVIFAPRAISEVWSFALTRLLPFRTKVMSLPSYLGHVKTQSLKLTFSQPVELSIDQKVSQVNEVCCEVRPTQKRLLNINLPAGRIAEPKESFRVSQLPKGKMIKSLVSRDLPWIYHSDLEEVQETFISLKENAKLSQAYTVLMALSILLATVGLFANSAPVIIGAMILAPLMAPIISLSMGVLRQEGDLMLDSSKTLLFGVLLALLGATIFAWLVPLQSLNSEISARLSPTLLDLAVAIISGIAGAYAHAKSEVAKSLAGVAIAVALVPPLAVSGIGIGWWDWHVFSGAFLLFLTNLVGIVLAAAATFLVLGFSPLHLAKRGLVISGFVVALISIPLSVAFYSMVQEQKMIYALESQPLNFLSGEAQLRDVQIRRGSPLEVSVTLVSDRTLAAYEIDQIKQQMENRLGEKIQLQATTAIVR